MSHAHGRLGNQGLGHFHHHHVSALRSILLGLQVSNLTKYYSGDKIDKNEMGVVQTGFWWGDLRERDHLQDLDVDGRVVLKWIFKKSNGVMGWIYLAQDRDRWQALVNAVMNFRFPYNVGNFLIS